jgi:hypothetical protein
MKQLPSLPRPGMILYPFTTFARNSPHDYLFPECSILGVGRMAASRTQGLNEVSSQKLTCEGRETF